MEEYLANKTITKAYRGKTGEGQYGPWVAWNFTIEGDDRKFSYFSGGKKPEPFDGAFIMMAKYETVTKGQYTNYNVKELALGQPENNEPGQAPPAGPGWYGEKPKDDYEPPGKPNKEESHKQGAFVPQPKPHPRNDEKISFFISYAKDLKVSLIEKGEYPEGVTLQECANDVMTVGRDMWEKANG